MKMEVEFKSDMNTETGSMPYYDMAERYGNEILDAKVGNTDMKVRHVFKKFVEVSILHSHSTYACDILIIFKCQHVWNNNCHSGLAFRQQTTTWKHTALIFLTSRTSECQLCLRFPCLRLSSSIRKHDIIININTHR